MLSIIGIGLASPDDISVKGLRRVRAADHIYLEGYTSKLRCSVDDLATFYDHDITVADRELVEQSDTILDHAQTDHVAFLVIGDVFAATTHYELFKEAREAGIETDIIYNASVLTAVSTTGLQLYKFGRTASIPFRNNDVTTPLNILESNQDIGLHTLFLLDLEDGQYMTVAEALDYLTRNDKITDDTRCVGCARLGSDNHTIRYGTVSRLKEADFGEPPHCLIVPGDTHFLEEEALETWACERFK
jgi:diphthine synthase